MQNVHTIKQCDQRYIAVLPAEKVIASPSQLQLLNTEIDNSLTHSYVQYESRPGHRSA